MRFGERLKQARQTMHLTQDQVANDFFVTRQTISSWENEKTYPDMTSLIKLSDYYHISLDTLLKEDTGMRETLEKKTVANGLKPLMRNMIINDLLFLVLLIGDISGLINSKHLIMLIVTILTFINVFTMLSLQRFADQNTLNINYYNLSRRFPKKSWNVLFPVLILLIVLGIGLSLYLWIHKQSLLSGLFSGITFMLVIYIVYHYRNH
ncbi:helix-turn-helix domain-containing protein [Nicoliella lavandulae]|uniref:Helix-turn-helix transcriptional regulator n=1 Tax=Nicoliella lavandulae TaxID=3082954 RepID=A0ABU8SKB6_9LACO